MKAIYSIFWLKLEKICKNEARWERISIDKYVNGEARHVQVPCSFLMKKKDNKKKIAPQRQKKKIIPFVLSPTQDLNTCPVKHSDRDSKAKVVS